MNQNFNQLQVRFPGLGCWVFILIGAWVLGAIGITGILKSIFAVALFLILAPVIAFAGLQFWLRRNLVEGNCPVCEQPLTSLKNLKMACPNCGTEVMVTAEGFERVAAEGVIDIQAVDVQSTTVGTSQVDTSQADSAVIDVEVQRLPEAND
ncbi:MAG: hypothetical protein AAFP20_14495 [Cyanobacteria bacterium J06614_10]